MFINLDRPLVVFDLETTGLFPKRDRIIELGAIKVMPDGAEEATIILKRSRDKKLSRNGEHPN